MSFGFSVGDFIAVYDKAKGIAEACHNGPQEFRELGREVGALQITVHQLKKDVDDPRSILRRKGAARVDDLKQIIDNCKIALDEAQGFIDKHSSIQEPVDIRNPGKAAKRVWHGYQVGKEDLDNVRGKLTFYTSTVDLFLNSLQIASLGRIERMVYELYRKQVDNPHMSTSSIASISSMHTLADDESDPTAWSVLEGELRGAGISDSDIQDHRAQIISYIKDLILVGVSVQVQANGEDEYDPEIVDLLDLIDPEVATLSTLNNVQNSLFVPDLSRFVNRRPIYRRALDNVSEETLETTSEDTPQVALKARAERLRGLFSRRALRPTKPSEARRI